MTRNFKTKKLFKLKDEALTCGAGINTFCPEA